MYCHNCGKPMIEAARYCAACGAGRVEPQAPIIATVNEAARPAPIFRTPVPQRLALPLKVMSWSFLLSVLGFIAFIGLAGDKSLAPAAGIALVIWMVGAIAFYVSLGQLATRLDRSVVLWVGGAMLTNPIGPFVAYFRMSGLVHTTARRIAEVRNSYQ